MKKNQGFTLVEMVVVIVLLGILAITAAPKFINLAGDARAGTLKAVQASMQSANTIVYNKAILAGSHKAATGTVTDSGTTINLAFGYVKSTQADVEAVLDLDGNFIVAVAPANTAIGTAATDIVIYPNGSTAPTASTTLVQACVLVYKQAASATTKPTYSVLGQGC